MRAPVAVPAALAGDTLVICRLVGESKQRAGGQRAGAGVVRGTAYGTANDIAENQVIGSGAARTDCPR